MKLKEIASQFYKRNFDHLLLLGRVTLQNVNIEMPGLVILLKTKEILEKTTLPKVLLTVDKIVISPGKQPTLESYN